MVTVSRHGVRSPTWTPERLNRYSAGRWPDFGVPPGYLTPHGREAMKLMGSYYRDWFLKEALLGSEDCRDARRIYIRADTDQRTVESGRALAEALAPGCGVAVHSAPGGEKDPLFSAAGIRRPPAKDVNVAAEALADLNTVLGGQGVPASEGSVAASLAEDMLLEYLNGFSGKDLGWGRLNAGNLEQILSLHADHAEATRRAPEIARARGSNLLAHVLASMQQTASDKTTPGAVGRPRDTVLILIGHDTNISNISGMLGISWHLPGYPANETPPGGALVFSLWQDSAGRRVVRTQYLAQTPDQMHDMVPLSLASPPAIENIQVPGCAAPDCDWSTFESVLKKAIDPKFVPLGGNYQM
ncbi:MAG: histidine-type phosphatase [Bryobacteraceae bacterium]